MTTTNPTAKIRNFVIRLSFADGSKPKWFAGTKNGAPTFTAFASDAKRMTSIGAPRVVYQIASKIGASISVSGKDRRLDVLGTFTQAFRNAANDASDQAAAELDRRLRCIAADAELIRTYLDRAPADAIEAGHGNGWTAALVEEVADKLECIREEIEAAI